VSTKESQQHVEMALQMIIVGIVLFVTSTFGGYMAYVCRQQSRRKAKVEDVSSPSPRHAQKQRAKSSSEVSESQLSDNNSIYGTGSIAPSESAISHHSSTSVKSLPEFIPNYVNLDKTVEANRGSIKLCSLALPPLGYTPSDCTSSLGGGSSMRGSQLALDESYLAHHPAPHDNAAMHRAKKLMVT